MMLVGVFGMSLLAWLIVIVLLLIVLKALRII